MRTRTVLSTVLFVAIGCLLLLAVGQAASAQAMKLKINTDASGYSEPVWPELSTPASITVWTWIANADKLVPLFQKAFPSIQVDLKSVGQGQPEYTKLATAIQAGSGAPDVVQVEFQALPQFVETSGLMDISQYVGDTKPLFPEWTWNQVFLNGKLYAIPQDAGPEGLIYRKDLFDKHHIRVPRTWAEFERAGALLHQADPTKYLTFIAVNDQGEINGLLWQGGVFPFKNTPNGWKINFTSEAAKKVMNYWLGLVKKGYVQVANAWTPEWSHNLGQGAYAAVIGAAWSPTYEIEPYMEKGTTQQWRVAEMPQWNMGDKVDSNWGGSTDAVTTQTKYPEASALFAAWINTHKDAVAVLSTDIGQGGTRALHCSGELRQAAKLRRPECVPWWPDCKLDFHEDDAMGRQELRMEPVDELCVQRDAGTVYQSVERQDHNRPGPAEPSRQGSGFCAKPGIQGR